MANLKSVSKRIEPESLIEKIRMYLYEIHSSPRLYDENSWHMSDDELSWIAFPEKFGLIYLNRCWRNNPFSGYIHLIDTHSNMPIWVSNYYGKFFKGIREYTVLLTSRARIRGITNFLHQVLSDPDPKFPIAGKSRKHSGALEYFNHTVNRSSLEEFSGKEMITHGSEARYSCYYMGGILL